MIPVLKTKTGYTLIEGNPVLLSLDGKVKATLKTILADSWMAEDRAAFGVYLAEPFVLPDGMQKVGTETFQEVDGIVKQVCEVEASPSPPVLTTEEKVQRLMDSLGVTLEEFRNILAGSK